MALHGSGDEEVTTTEAGLAEDFVQVPPGPADERPPGFVLIPARRLPHENAVGRFGPLARNRFGPALPEAAPPAALHPIRDTVQLHGRGRLVPEILKEFPPERPGLRIRFGPSGLQDLGGLEEGLRAISEMGFSACEFDFVKEFWIGKKAAAGARSLVEDLGMAVRAHAPFYGVLSQGDPAKKVMAVAMMHHTANLVHLMGGDGITVHPGFYMGRSRGEVMETVRKRCRELEARLARNDLGDVLVGVENMGNRNEFGGELRDILDICNLSPSVFPIIDWAHIQATCDGCLRGMGDFRRILEEIEAVLGIEGLEKTRHQFSQVEYTEGVERRHLGYDEGDMRLEDLIDALQERGLDEVLIISESPGLADHRRMLEIVGSHE
jgi:deoxyribonuclease-4